MPRPANYNQKQIKLCNRLIGEIVKHYKEGEMFTNKEEEWAYQKRITGVRCKSDMSVDELLLLRDTLKGKPPKQRNWPDEPIKANPSRYDATENQCNTICDIWYTCADNKTMWALRAFITRTLKAPAPLYLEDLGKQKATIVITGLLKFQKEQKKKNPKSFSYKGEQG